MLSLAFVLFSITLLTFIIGYLAPGDPILVMMGSRRDPVLYERLLHQYGLDLPWWHQYLRFSAGLPHGALDHITTIVGELPRGKHELEMLLAENPLLKGRTKGVGYLDLTGCIALSITGPVLRSTGLPHDLRKSEPYCGYETYDFDVITRTGADAYDRLMIRILEMFESLKIVDYIYFVSEGRIVAQGPLELVMTEDNLSQTFGLPLELEQRGQRWAARARSGT